MPTLVSMLRTSASLVLLVLASTVRAQDSVDIGVLNVGPGSFRLGEYSGLINGGSYLRGDLSLDRSSSYNDPVGRYWQLQAHDLGLDTTALDFAAGARGSYGLKLAYRSLPHYRFDDSVVTPFRGAASSRQLLPADWVGASSTRGFSALQSSLQEVDIHTDRQHYSLGLRYRLSSVWTLDGAFERQRKKGNDTIGAMFGSTGGNPRSAILAAPVDYVTDNFTLGVSRSAARRSFSITYRASLFSNANPSLQWQNPFNNPSWRSGANFSDGAVGELALAPDNRSQNLTAALVQAFEGDSRLSASFSLGRMQQHETLLPYSNVFASAVPLPVSQINGDIKTINTALSWNTRIGSKLRMRMRYGLDVRDNDTSTDLWLRIAGDAAAQAAANSSNARVNRPYSYVKQKFVLDASVRLEQGRQLQFEYRIDEKRRDLVDVDTVREHTFGSTLLFPLQSGQRARVEYQHALRRGSDYVSNTGFLAGHNPDWLNTLTGDQLYENDPLLRRFHLADRNRDSLGFSLSRPVGTSTSLDISGNLQRDDFPDSRIGLRQSDGFRLGFSASHAISTRIDLNAWHTWQTYRNQQAGYQRTNSTPILPEAGRLATSNWGMSTRDRIGTTGAGLNWVNANERLQIKADVSYSDAKTTTLPAASGLAYLDFPAFRTRFATVSVDFSYSLGESGSLGLRWRHDDYFSTDFALNQVVTDSLANVLLLGNTNPVYAGSVVELRYRSLLPR